MRRPSLGTIFLTIFLDLLGFGLVIPFLAQEARDTFYTTALVGTLIASAYSLMQFLFVPVWGRLSDRVGRRPVLIFSVFATALSMLALGLALAYARSVIWLFAARTLGGIATANLGTASAYIADVTKPEERAKGMGLIGAAFGLGFILGPGIGGWLAQIEVNGRHGPVACYAAAGLSVVNLVWVVFGLPESLPPALRRKSKPRSLAPLNFSAAREVLADEGIGRAVLTNFLIILAFTNLEATFRYFNKDLFAMTEGDTATVLVFIGLMGAAVQGGFMRTVSKKYTDSSLIVAGLVLQALAFAGFAIAPHFGRGALYVAGALIAFGNGITQPSIAAFVSKRVDASSQGGALGTNQSVASLARVFGPALGGYLYGAVGPRAPYASGAVGLLVALAFAVRLRDAEMRAGLAPR